MMEFTAALDRITDTEGGTKVTFEVSEEFRKQVAELLVGYRGKNLSIKVKVLVDETFGRTS
jgi:hypothetical protein